MLYLDTSALVKLYVEEDKREVALLAVQTTEIVAISVVGYAEARAALVRRRNERRFNSDEYEQAVVELTQEWQTFVRSEVSEEIGYQAGQLAEEYGLRGFDAIHLATALHFDQGHGGVVFLCFDDRLNAAAVEAGLALYGDEHEDA